jgi:hypothetical protein
MISGGTRASGFSKARINFALEETRAAVAKRTTSEWSQVFYQYTNRLAHLYFLRTLNKVDAHLIYVYFINAKDVWGPTTKEEWIGAIKLMESFLGLQKHNLSKYMHHVFVDVEALPRTDDPASGLTSSIPSSESV